MAESPASKEYTIINSMAVHLRDALTEDYTTVWEPMIRGLVLDAVVAGPQGLFVLHGNDWGGEIRAAQRGPWRERTASGQVVSHPDPGRKARRATKVLNAFLRDEFPSLRPPIHHLVVLTNPSAKLTGYGAVQPSCVPLDSLATEITSVATPAKSQLDRETCERLAVALRDRQLTRTQRAAQPFIFRAGGAFGVGRKAWTIRQVVRHMDRYPEDGIHHLRNGSLERWFSDQGASHLAALAQEVLRQGGNDPRVSLEAFLLGTGLVRRPRITIRPKRMGFGYVLSGAVATRRFRLRKGRGRGYLFGSLQAGDAWLLAEPDHFSKSLDAVVTINTDALLITAQPSRAEILVVSSASDDPISVPVDIHITPMPAAVNRYLVRPLIGLIVAGLLGGILGSVLGSLGLPAPAWLRELASPPVSSTLAWALFLAALWAVIGGVQGFLQNPAWPTGYATRRFLSRTVAWGIVLALATAGLLGFIGWLYPDVPTTIAGAAGISTSVIAACAAILPGAAGEIAIARRREKTETSPKRRPWLRRHGVALVMVVLVFAIVAGIRFAGPVLKRYDTNGARLGMVRERASDQFAQWQATLDSWMDQLYIHYYDRRAPAPTETTPLTETTTPAEATSTPVP